MGAYDEYGLTINASKSTSQPTLTVDEVLDAAKTVLRRSLSVRTTRAAESRN